LRIQHWFFEKRFKHTVAKVVSDVTPKEDELLKVESIKKGEEN